MGISSDEFWRLNPRTLNIALEGYKLRRKVKDEEQWIMGGYFFNALTIALGNAFRKKNAKVKTYFEEIKEPYLSHIDQKEMTEEEKDKQRQLIMAQLRTMQTNFNIKHGK